ncbi:MAG TPA: hypothetical protein DEA71_13725 [Nitrospira sp.]|nr:hypothetical protein [Nitrospira sp.]
MNSCLNKMENPSVSIGSSVVLHVAVMAIVVAAAQFIWISNACAVRPFVTDDARTVYKGQLVTESYGGITMAQGEKPAIEARSLQGLGITDRLELTAGGFGLTYRDNQARPLDMLIQPKYVIHSSLGMIPSLSASAATLFPLSGNRQHWDGYVMAQLSWFLFTPDPETDPYDNNLSIHFNLGTKYRYDAGPATFQSKLYWAAGFEVITPMTREIRFLGEVFNGDPFGFEEKFPAFQTGFRWYRTPNMQLDMVLRGIRNTTEDVRFVAGGGGLPEEWNYTIQFGFRYLIDLFR